MTANDLMAAFETLADAPDGVKRLRELVLQLAVRGKLVPQDSLDESAQKLVRRVVVERTAAGGRASKGGSVAPDEIAFEVPSTWVWVRFGDIFECRLGKMLDKAKNRGHLRPYLRNANVRWGSFDLSDVLEMRLEDHEVTDVTVRKGDLVICEGGEPGRAAVWDSEKPFVIQKALHRARPYLVDARYYQIHLRVDCASGRVAESFTGATIQHFTGQVLDKHTVTLPPLAEQHRIVARVDELMSLLDRLEAARTARDDLRRAARDAALAALRDAEETESVEAAWGRIAGQVGALFAAPEDVGPLRQAVLGLAVRGRLVEQRPKEEALGKASDGLPQGWTRGLLSTWFDVKGGIQKSGKRAPARNAWPYLRVANVQRGELHLAEIAKFELFDDELDRYRLFPGDILVVEGNGSESEIGRCARWNGDIDNCVHQNHLIRCRPLVAGIEHFIMLFLNSPDGMATMRSLAVTTSGLFNLSVGKIKAIEVVLPPLAEQQRIVAKVDELMAMCDTLEARITTARDLHQQFADAAIHHLDV